MSKNRDDWESGACGAQIPAGGSRAQSALCSGDAAQSSGIFQRAAAGYAKGEVAFGPKLPGPGLICAEIALLFIVFDEVA